MVQIHSRAAEEDPEKNPSHALLWERQLNSFQNVVPLPLSCDTELYIQLISYS